MTKFSFLFSVIYVLIASFNLSAQQDLKTNASSEQLDSLFAEWNKDMPGIAIGIVKNGKIDHLKGYGLANLEHSIPITPQTKFLYHGMSDQIIAYAILLLEKDGLLSLDDNISKHINLTKSFDESIKIKHLLSHTSGINDLATLKNLAGWAADDAFSKAQALPLILSQKSLNSRPGQIYKYTKIGIRLLQEIIETISLKTIGQFAEDNIFQPLEMTNSLFTDSSDALIENRAQGYYQMGDKQVVGQIIENYSQPAFFYSTVEDMCKWAMNFDNIKVGNKQMVNQANSLTKVNDKEVDLNNSALYLGQHRYWKFNGLKKLYLIGMGNGYACKLVRFPEQDLSIVVMGNSGAYNGHWSSFAADLYLKPHYEKTDAPNNQQDESVKIDKNIQAKYVGKYWNDNSLYTTSVTLKNDTLIYFEEEFNWEMKLMATSEKEYVSSYGHKIEFKGQDAEKQLVLTMPNGLKEISKIYPKLIKTTSYFNKFTGEYKNEDISTTYCIELEKEKLFIKHARLGTFELFPLGNNRFKTESNTLKYLHFDNSQNQNMSMKISNNHIKDLHFVSTRENQNLN